jgi:glycosyltransferase involved in cell wall biosynthesis
MNNAEILVSIVTPSYNQGLFVEETILSVLSQTYPHTEYIFVDGGSTDNTMKIVEKYRDKIDIIIHEKDKGQADAINKGFKLAHGKLVGWINSDDLLYPDCVEKIVALYQHDSNGAIYYHSLNDMIGQDGSPIRTYQRIIPDLKYLLRINYDVIQQGSFYSMEIVKRVNYLDIENYYCMDLDLWFKLLKYGPIYYTNDKPHAAFRLYPVSKTGSGQEKFIANIYRVLKKNGAKLHYPTIWKRIYPTYIKKIIKKVLSL